MVDCGETENGSHEVDATVEMSLAFSGFGEIEA